MNTPEEAIAKLEADYKASTQGDHWTVDDNAPAMYRAQIWVAYDPAEASNDGVAEHVSPRNAAHIVSIHNATPALLAIAKATIQQVAAYEHVRDCEEEGEGACCLEVQHQAYLANKAAAAALGEAVK